MEYYNVDGMTCAACVAHVEKAVKGVAGVEEVSVSLLTNSMQVEGAVDSALICQAVEKAGYHARVKHSSDEENGKPHKGLSADDLKDRETPMLIHRFGASVVLLLPLMYITMGHMMWDWPLPFFFHNNHIGIAIAEMILSGTVLAVNRNFFISGAKSTIHGAPNMDTLVALGSGVSYLYSLYVLFQMTYWNSIGNAQRAMESMHNLYFESAAMIVTLITVGKTLEAYSRGKTTNALKGLMDLAPKTAICLVDGEEVVVDADELKVGDYFLVKPGNAIPTDGVVTEGISSVDESALTGESVLVDKTKGSEVSVGTMNVSGVLTCQATRVGEDTTLSAVIRMVSDAAATKAPIARTADFVAGIFTPVVCLLAVLTAVVWLLNGAGIGFALEHAIAVLVISCPCALGLATPVAIMVGSGVGAKNGILYKNAAALEEAGRAKVVVLDKTGTITSGKPQVTDVIPTAGVTEEELLTYAYSLESLSQHPLALAVCDFAGSKGLSAKTVTEFEDLAGNGIRGIMDDASVFAGKVDYIYSMITDKGRQALGEFNESHGIHRLTAEGKTIIYITRQGMFLGVIAVADVIKRESPLAVKELKQMGMHVVMLTGDHRLTAEAIASQVGVDEVVAGVLPAGKEAVVKKLQESGSVIMVGDGINDAVALTRANVGFAIGAGTDIAIDAADVVLVNSYLTDVVAAVRLSRAVLRNIKENLFWAFIYNVIGIPIAAGVYYGLNGWTMSPMMGAAAMSLSSFCVVMNALRLNLVSLHKEARFRRNVTWTQPPLMEDEEILRQTDEGKNQRLDFKTDTNQQEDKQMEKIITVNGMMCEHCERHVKEALEKVPGVVQATGNHETNTVTLELDAEVSKEALKVAVKEAGYEYVD
ncbi:Cu2+-exporting ATPase [Lachnospiraceae bacterium KHCPX20]|nr:Cu2+-exporting ATPase [Lachnospiraceae bacterium KHCPX20]